MIFFLDSYVHIHAISKESNFSKIETNFKINYAF